MARRTVLAVLAAVLTVLVARTAAGQCLRTPGECVRGSDVGHLAVRPACAPQNKGFIFYVDDGTDGTCGTGGGSVKCTTRCNGTSWDTVDAAGTGSSGAPTTAAYWTNVGDASLSGEQNMSALGTGLVRNTSGTGVPTIYAGVDAGIGMCIRALDGSGAISESTDPLLSTEVDTSTEMAATVGDETGTGALTFATKPLLVRPRLQDYTVGTLPASDATNPGSLARVIDSAVPGDCVLGGGASRTLCVDTGNGWLPLGDGGGLEGVTSTLGAVAAKSYETTCAGTDDCRLRLKKNTSGCLDEGTGTISVCNVNDVPSWRLGGGGPILPLADPGTPWTVPKGGTGSNDPAIGLFNLSQFSLPGQMTCTDGQVTFPCPPCANGQVRVANSSVAGGWECGSITLTNAVQTVAIRTADSLTASAATVTDLGSASLQLPTPPAVGQGMAILIGGTVGSSSGHAVDYTVRVNGTTVLTWSVTTPPTTALPFKADALCAVRAAGATGSVKCSPATLAIDDSASSNGTLNAWFGKSPTPVTVDLSPTTLTVTTHVQWTTGGAGDAFTEEGGKVDFVSGTSVTGSDPGVAPLDHRGSFTFLVRNNQGAGATAVNDPGTTCGSSCDMIAQNSPGTDTTNYVEGGRSASFDPGSYKCATATCTALSNTTSSFSCLGWARPTSSSVDHALFLQSSLTDGRWAFQTGPGNLLQCAVENQSKNSGSTQFNVNGWNGWGCVYNGPAGTLRALLNGVDAGTGSVPTSFTNAHDFNIGTNTSVPFAGQMDPVACADGKILAASMMWRELACGLDGAACRCDTADPTQYKLCNQDTDCGPGGQKCDTTTTPRRCRGYADIFLGGVTLPACNVAAP